MRKKMYLFPKAKSFGFWGDRLQRKQDPETWFYRGIVP